MVERATERSQAVEAENVPDIHREREADWKRRQQLLYEALIGD